MNPSLHFRTWLVLALVLSNVAVIGVSGYWLQQSRQQHELRTRTLTQSVGSALDRQVSGSIQLIDLALSAVVDELEQQLSLKGRLDDAATGAFLAKYEQRLPEINAFRVADKNGVVIAGQGVEKSGRASWADRDFFVHFREHNDGALKVSKPIIGRVSQQYVIAFTRRYHICPVDFTAESSGYRRGRLKNAVARRKQVYRVGSFQTY